MGLAEGRSTCPCWSPSAPGEFLERAKWSFSTELAISCPSRASAFVGHARLDPQMANGKAGHDIGVIGDAATVALNVGVEDDSVETGVGNSTSS